MFTASLKHWLLETNEQNIWMISMIVCRTLSRRRLQTLTRPDMDSVLEIRKHMHVVLKDTWKFRQTIADVDLSNYIKSCSWFYFILLYIFHIFVAVVSVLWTFPAHQVCSAMFCLVLSRITCMCIYVLFSGYSDPWCCRWFTVPRMHTTMMRINLTAIHNYNISSAASIVFVICLVGSYSLNSIFCLYCYTEL